MNNNDRTEFENYIANRFERQQNVIHNDDFITQWQEWINDNGAADILNEKICAKRPVSFESPEAITIEIYEAAAGKVPVIVLGNAADFENFIVNLIYKGERPYDISQMGASFIYGKKQRFLVLSKKYYSNTQPDFVGLSPQDWHEKSMILRREHELAHYYTKNFYGSASNNLHDELIADFIGIYEAFGYYKAAFFKHFMGIDGTHEGRLSLYTAGLSHNVRQAIAIIAGECADSLEAWTKTANFIDMNKSDRINYLCETSVKDLANRGA